MRNIVTVFTIILLVICNNLVDIFGRLSFDTINSIKLSGEIMEGCRSKNISCVASKFGSPTIYKNENAIHRNEALNQGVNRLVPRTPVLNRNKDLALKPNIQSTGNTSC